MADDENYVTLATAVRQKHPGAYDHVSDEVLAGKYAGKYPEYRRFLKAPAAAESPSWGDLALTGAGAAAKSVLMAPINIGRAIWDAKDPVTLANRMIVQPSIEQGKKAWKAGTEGRYSEAAGHALGMTPLVGPAAASIGEKIGTGDPTKIAEGFGETAALVGTGPALRAAGPVVAATGRLAQESGRGMWRRAAKVPESIAAQTGTFKKTGNLTSGGREIAETVLSRGRGGLTEKNTKALLQEQATAGRAVKELAETSRVTGSPADIIKSLDAEIANMRLAEMPDEAVAAALARRNELAARWTEKQTNVSTWPAGERRIDPATAGRVRDAQVQGYVEMVDRPTMRQAEARVVPGPSRFPTERPIPPNPPTRLTEAGEMLRQVLDDQIEGMRQAGKSADDIQPFLEQRNDWLSRMTEPAPGPTSVRVPTQNPRLGESFEAVHGRRPPAEQAALNEAQAVPDVVRMGGRAGEYSPVASLRTTTTGPKAITARKVQALKKSPGSGPLATAVRKAAIKWQDKNVPGLAGAKATFGKVTPAARAMNKATYRESQTAPVGMTQAALTPLGVPALLAYLQRGGPLSHLAQGAYSVGGRMRQAGRAMPAIRYSAFPTQGLGLTAGQELEEDAARRELIERLRNVP